MALLTRDEILNANDLAREQVEVPEWGGAVLVRALTGRERDAYESSIVHPNGRAMKYTLTNMRARLVSLSGLARGTGPGCSPGFGRPLSPNGWPSTSSSRSAKSGRTCARRSWPR